MMSENEAEGGRSHGEKQVTFHTREAQGGEKRGDVPIKHKAERNEGTFQRNEGTFRETRGRSN